ncbi:hypothetical protein CDAR_292321 [Caerostris darwini]|uniref:Uncharacterized protein n=1 Tax=Caerostris darwini TaxID=1538125 RepID=A0AAV4UD33_9ARAC|nr:hypothetical protein CDAR_292321 [Caerostris darwini]
MIHLHNPIITPFIRCGCIKFPYADGSASEEEESLCGSSFGFFMNKAEETICTIPKRILETFHCLGNSFSSFPCNITTIQWETLPLSPPLHQTLTQSYPLGSYTFQFPPSPLLIPWRPIRPSEKESEMFPLSLFDCSPRRHGIRKRTMSCFVSKMNRAPVPEETVTVMDTNDAWHPRIWLR